MDEDNSMADTNDKGASAASRVFGIVELTEKILFAYAKSVDIKKEPATQLFALKRVNTTFNDIIVKHHKAFAPYMWLTAMKVPSGHPDRVRQQLVSRLLWLFKRLLNSAALLPKGRSMRDLARNSTNGAAVAKGHVYIELSKPVIAPEGHPDKLLRTFLRKEASWRKMVTTGTKDVKVTVRMHVAPERVGALDWVNDPNFRYRSQFQVKGGTDLWNVYNSYKERFDRTSQHHKSASRRRIVRTDAGEKRRLDRESDEDFRVWKFW